VLFYGCFYGFTEGTEKALLADILPAEKRGVGFGALQLVLGLAALPASILTGWLMTQYGSQIAFSASAGFALLGLLGFILWRLRQPVDVNHTAG
jgi:MFS family permease